MYSEDPKDALVVGKLLTLDQYIYVFTLIGGLEHWTASGYPIVRGATSKRWKPLGDGASRTSVIHRAQAILTYNLLGDRQRR